MVHDSLTGLTLQCSDFFSNILLLTRTLRIILFTAVIVQVEKSSDSEARFPEQSSSKSFIHTHTVSSGSLLYMSKNPTTFPHNEKSCLDQIEKSLVCRIQICSFKNIWIPCRLRVAVECSFRYSDARSDQNFKFLLFWFETLRNISMNLQQPKPHESWSLIL